MATERASDPVQYETVDGVLIHHHPNHPILHIDDHAATIEAYANNDGNICAFIEGDEPDGNANEGDKNFGYAFLLMTPAESRYLGKHLIAQADKAQPPAAPEADDAGREAAIAALRALHALAAARREEIGGEIPHGAEGRDLAFRKLEIACAALAYVEQRSGAALGQIDRAAQGEA